MPNKLQIKRSAVQGAVPTTGVLDLGELALNTNDGRIFMRRTVGTVSSIVAFDPLTSSSIGTALGYTAFSTTGGTLTGALILSADPTADLGAATKQYVDSLPVRRYVRATTTANLSVTETTQTLTNSGTLAAFAIDGISLSVNDRVLIKDQTVPRQNGIYTVTNVGSGSVQWVLTRADDGNSWNDLVAAQVVVKQGTVNSDTLWFSRANAGGTLGSNDVIWQLVSNAQVASFGNLSTNGIAVRAATGSVVARSIAVSGTGLTVSNADGVSGNPTVTSNATNANTASTLVARDANGNFTAGTITAALVGNASTATSATSATVASTATALAVSRDFSISGDATAPAVGFTGAGNVALSLTLATLAGLTAGTYTKFTVNVKGQVTAASTLAFADIPDLDMTKLPSSAFKKSVRAATTANITLSGLQTIDGIILIANDRVLVKDQSIASANGIYLAAAGAWTRAADADNITEIAGGVVNTDSGTVNGGRLFTTFLKTTDTLGTTAMTWNGVLDFSDTASANTAGKVVIRDAGGSFSAGTITAALFNGSVSSAVTASTLAVSRNFSLSGDVTSNTVGFNGSGDVSLTVALATQAGLSAGTYTSVAVNTKGIVTSASNPTTISVGATGFSYTATTALGTTVDNENIFNSSRILNSNSDNLITRAFRVTNGTDWTTAAWEIRRRVDVTNGAFIRFGGTNNINRLSLGENATERLVMFNTTLTFNSNNIWHAGNDGATSGLDADLLDGQQGSWYQDATNLTAGTIPSARVAGIYESITGIGIGDTVNRGPIVTFGAITPGSAYVPGTYTAVSLTGGSGLGATATIVVDGFGNVSSVTLVAEGNRFIPGDVLSATLAGGGTGFSIPVSTVRQAAINILGTSPRIRLGHNLNVAAGNEIGSILFGTNDSTAGGRGDKVRLVATAAGTAAGGELEIWTSDNGGEPKLAVDITGTNTFRLFNSASTFYSAMSAPVTANRTLTLADGNTTLVAGTMVPTTGTGATGSWGITASSANTATTLATSRTLTIGSTGKSFNGSADVAWTLAEIGALPSAGGTLTGALVISQATPTLTLNKSASGANAVIVSKTNNVDRWIIVAGSSDAESGGNAGSDFAINRYSDVGSYVGSPIIIRRNTGVTEFQAIPTGPASDPTTAGQLTRKAYVDAQRDTRVAKAGDTMTGSLQISGSWAAVVLTKPTSGSGAQLLGYVGPSLRWSAYLGDSTSETGSNVGSDFSISRFSDAGSFLSTSLLITRSTGVVSFFSTPLVSSNTVWHAGNDGAGSGLDADLLDGLNSSTLAGVSTIAARDVSGNLLAAGFMIGSDTNNALIANSLFLRGTSPTVYLRDTDGRCGFVHVNSNKLYLLGSTTNDTTTWTQVNSQWPAYWDLTNNNCVIGGTLTINSDIRIKENIADISNPIDLLMGLKGVYYNLKGDDKKQIGFIAQWVRKNIPELVLEAGDNVMGDIPNMLSVDYGRTTAILAEVGKNHEDRITYLNNKVNELSKANEILLARLEALESKLLH